MDKIKQGMRRRLTRHEAIFAASGLIVVRGNLVPDEAVIKQSAAHPALLQHTGRAVVFDGLGDLVERLDRDDLGLVESDILVLRYVGPKGAPGMPKVGLIPIPKKPARQGVRDMMRISDGRMSATASGTIILHVAPEAAIGGPLALVQSGDRICLDAAGRRLELLVSDDELAHRQNALQLPVTAPNRGYGILFHDHVVNAPGGFDFDFLQGVDAADAEEWR